MRRGLSRLAWYFGIAPDDRESSAALTAVRADLIAGAVWLAASAVAMSALMVIAFDWSPPEMLPGAVFGAAAWGAVKFFTDVRARVPAGARLPQAPADAVVDPKRREPWRMLLVLPLLVGLAWSADRWDLGAVFVPGQFLGYALADLAGALLVGRWQDRNGGTVLLRWNRDEPELYTV